MNRREVFLLVSIALTLIMLWLTVESGGSLAAASGLTLASGAAGGGYVWGLIYNP